MKFVTDVCPLEQIAWFMLLLRPFKDIIIIIILVQMENSFVKQHI